MIGDKGLAREAVLLAIECQPQKPRADQREGGRRATRDARQRRVCWRDICAALDASPVQHIGKVLVLYREQHPTVEPTGVDRETGGGGMDVGLKLARLGQAPAGGRVP